MIYLYEGTDETVPLSAVTDADGQAYTGTATLVIDGVGEWDATVTDGAGDVTVLGADTDGLTGPYRYLVLVSDTVAEEGVAVLRNLPDM